MASMTVTVYTQTGMRMTAVEDGLPIELVIEKIKACALDPERNWTRVEIATTFDFEDPDTGLGAE